MEGASFAAGAPAASPSLVKRPRFIPSRSIETTPPRHGEKPYEQVVRAAFDGPILRLSSKLKLLEEADNRHIRRGDALDLMHATRRELEAEHRVRPHGRLHAFFTRYAIFLACYVMFALIWCVILSRH